MMKHSGKLSIRALAEGAVLLAVAQILGYIKLFQMPQGGSVTLNMLPIFLFCARWGFGPGLLMSFAYSLLQLFLDGAYAWGWQSILGDYLLAYTVLGVSGLFHKQKGGFFIGAAVGSVLRFLCHFVTGATVWGEYMPEAFFGMTMTSPWLYSALYNGSTIFAGLVLVLLVGWLVWKRLGGYFRGDDLKK